MKRQDLIGRLILWRDKIDLDINNISVKEPLIEVSAGLSDVIEELIKGPVEE